MSTRGFLIEILLQRHNAEHREIIPTFLFTFITRRLQEHLVGHLLLSNTFSNFFHDYDVTALKIIDPITFRKYAKHSIKVLRNKNKILF